MGDFEPEIIGFICAYGAYRTNNSPFTLSLPIRLIKVNCSSIIDTVFILNALKNGTDGVIIAEGP